ncbi:PD-(D/E)XK nuclease family protein [Campylobacter porcelli]|uniref:PD-(D/E)XK nuclease domain protein n=1 Tax=Campylobacter porcelli TaxID=1660073 RepID=A0A1X9SVX5_9BACT|nr:PD-(D/E)XK nuclease family protein [Campylobacter sp. RM6137]ARR00343.1 PD-(D/E)XK nuclease domain protein [Campylobacter sp. RM6137]
MAEFNEKKLQKFFAEFEKAYNEYENKVKERRARGIHDYNIFDVLETKEVKHSKFIASLLDPKGLHYQGDLFLREFINACGISDFGLDASNALVYREYKNIDIYITDGDKHIMIENKLWTGDHNEQIARYIRTIIGEIGEQNEDSLSEICERILVLYLTPSDDVIKKLDGIDEVKNDSLIIDNNEIAFKHISYKKEIIEWLCRVKDEITNLMDLTAIISQYEKAVKILTNQGEKMANDIVKEQIRSNYELCAAIYDNFKSVEIELTNNFFEKVYSELNNNLEIQDNWKLSFNKFENKNICVIEITPEELKYNKYVRFVVERKTNEILYGFLKNNEEIKLKDMNIQAQYYDWYLAGDFAFESMTPKDFILKNIKNENGVEEYINKILSDIKNGKDKLKEINNKINGD